MSSAWCRAVALLAAMAGGITALAHDALAHGAWTHPLHTTMAELSCAPGTGVELVLRAFADDFSAAAGASPERYLARTLSLTDGAGRPVHLRVTAVRHAGDLAWITLRAPGASPPACARLTNRVLFERYDDQVNIVQATVAGRRRTLLFTRTDGAAGKEL